MEMLQLGLKEDSCITDVIRLGTAVGREVL